jgi:hypothetical protein
MDWDKVEVSKKAERARLAALPIGEKLHLLEAMRRRAAAIKGQKSFIRSNQTTGKTSQPED